jgi:hypothetical protein
MVPRRASPKKIGRIRLRIAKINGKISYFVLGWE